MRALIAMHFFTISGRSSSLAGDAVGDAIEEGAVADGAVLDDLGHAGGEFLRGQRGERVEIGNDEARLVERADEILTLGQVDAGLAADGAVDHGEERGGNLDEGDTAQVARGDEAGEVAHHAAAETDDRAGARHLDMGELGREPHDLLHGLARFAGG